MHIAVIGAGSWGTALAIHASQAGHDVRIWSRNSAVVESINREHVNRIYLTHAEIPSPVKATNNIAEVLDASEMMILAAPSHATRELLTSVASTLNSGTTIVSATKGIEIDSGKRISQIAGEVLGEDIRPRFVCLSGPSFAKEVVEKHPTAVVAASEAIESSALVQSQLSFDSLRIYTNEDVIGTELCGSVKNVMAIAAGMVAGLGYGSNSIAALITRGLAEMTRLALREGAKVETAMGLAGVGDLVLTCTGGLSRNRFVGHELGRGRTLEEITAGMNEVAEGVKTTLAVKRLADHLEVEMPITNEVHHVLYEKKSVTEAVGELMSRPLRVEAD